MGHCGTPKSENCFGFRFPIFQGFNVLSFRSSGLVGCRSLGFRWFVGGGLKALGLGVWGFRAVLTRWLSLTSQAPKATKQVCSEGREVGKQSVVL